MALPSGQPLALHIDRGNGVPAYVQLVRQLREAVLLGWLQPGDQLPSVRDVASVSALNPNTVLRAYRELAVLGIVETRQGAGVYVSATASATPSKVLARFRVQLDRWVKAARDAGLRDEDMEALLRAAVAEPTTRRRGTKGVA